MPLKCIDHYFSACRISISICFSNKSVTQVSQCFRCKCWWIEPDLWRHMLLPICLVDDHNAGILQRVWRDDNEVITARHDHAVLYTIMRAGGECCPRKNSKLSETKEYKQVFILTSYRGADKSLARPTSRCILFDGENISVDASLIIYK